MIKVKSEHTLTFTHKELNILITGLMQDIKDHNLTALLDIENSEQFILLRELINETGEHKRMAEFTEFLTDTLTRKL